MIRPPADRLVLLAFLIAVLVLGSNWVAVRFSNRELPPFWGATVRFTVASALMFAIVALRGMRLPRARSLQGALIFGALTFGANFGLIYWALVEVPAGMTSVVFATLPLMTVIAASAAGLERLGRASVLGALLGVIGVGVIFRDQVTATVPPERIAAILVSAALAAVATVVVKKFPQSHPISTNAVATAVGAAILLATSLALGEPRELPRILPTWLALAWLVMSTIVGFALLLWVVQRWTASASAYATVVSPIVTVVVANLLAGEVFGRCSSSGRRSSVSGCTSAPSRGAPRPSSPRASAQRPQPDSGRYPTPASASAAMSRRPCARARGPAAGTAARRTGRDTVVVAQAMAEGRSRSGPSMELLRTQLAAAYDLIRGRIEGLTDEEFWWEPVAGCWTVRQGADGRWSADYPEPPHPDPPPFTTIAWRLVHVAECKLMYHEYAFGAAKLIWPEIDSAHTAADAIAALERGQRLLLDDLDGIEGEELGAMRLTNWGEEWPTWRIFTTMIHHDLQHGGEIGVLRDLYRIASLRSQGPLPLGPKQLI